MQRHAGKDRIRAIGEGAEHNAEGKVEQESDRQAMIEMGQREEEGHKQDGEGRAMTLLDRNLHIPAKANLLGNAGSECTHSRE